MIENNGIKYYQTNEISKFIEDADSEIGKKWRLRYKQRGAILSEQVQRILYNAKKERKIPFVVYKKNESAKKKFFGFSLKDVMDFLDKEFPENIVNLEFVNKE
ncbi:hypothetical protein II906_10040 [bacterium]|nr:hypothetical protein [bacterium]